MYKFAARTYIACYNKEIAIRHLVKVTRHKKVEDAKGKNENSQKLKRCGISNDLRILCVA